MSPNEIFEHYMCESKLMQIATVGKNGNPWICTVYFVVDKANNFYWLSLPTRRHSSEIMENKRAAVAVACKFDQPVIGVQAEGTVEVVEHSATIQGIMEKYIAKNNSGHDFYDNFLKGTAEHRMYRFVPERIVLFDEVHYKGKPQEIVMKA